MSKIDELIQEYCPDGVNYLQLGEVASYIRGITYSKNDESADGSIKVLRANNIDLRTNTLNLDDVKTVNSTVRVRTNQRLFADDILISAASGSKAHVGKVAYIHDDLDYCFGGFMAVLRTTEQLDSRFLFHLLVGSTFSRYLEGTLASTTINNLSASIMNAFKVPVPPLEAQKEIVNILDKFTQLEAELSAELSAELEARRTQYDYYLNKLLTLDSAEGVRKTTLGEIGVFIRGNGLQKKDFTESGVGCIHYGQIFTHYGTYAEKTKTFVSLETAKKARRAKPGNLVIATTSENDEDVCKAVAWLGDAEVAVSSDAMIYDHEENPKYISYLFQTQDFFKQKKKYISGTKVRRVSSQNLAKINVAIPSRQEQDRIVNILDKFDKLTTDISEGLPAEITARHLQYEYYRTKLLTFQEQSA